jgi:hypothetical protein
MMFFLSFATFMMFSNSYIWCFLYNVFLTTLMVFLYNSYGLMVFSYNSYGVFLATLMVFSWQLLWCFLGNSYGGFFSQSRHTISCNSTKLWIIVDISASSDWILMIFTPLDSSQWEDLNGMCFITIASILTELSHSEYFNYFLQ